MEALEQARKLLENGDRAGAVRELATYLHANLNNIGGWQLLATALDDPSQKAKCYWQILRIDSNNEEAAEALQLVSSSAKNRTEVILIAAQPYAEPHAAVAPPKFSNNQEVQLQNEPRRRGIILGEPIYSNERWQYEVFFSDEKRFVAEADLLVVCKLSFATN